MKGELIEKLSAVNEEEKQILVNSEIDRRVYSPSGDFIINDKRLTKGKFGVIMRTHPRYTVFPQHKHTFIEIMIVLSGKIIHTIDGEDVCLSQGDVLFLNKHTTHSIAMTDTEDIGVNIILSDKFADALFPELSGTVFSDFFEENRKKDGVPMHLHFSTLGHRDVENLIENLLLGFIDTVPDEYVTEKTLSLLLYRLSKLRHALLKNKVTSTDKENARRLEITSYIKTSYRTASLTELADRMYITPEYLSKITVKYFGKSFKELVLCERIERAVDLLKNTSLPISTVIRNMGYENESYFHREFKKRLGATPKEVRASQKAINSDNLT